MKTLTGASLLLSTMLAAATLNAAAALPKLDVLVTDPAGKVVYKGNTNGAGSFATGKVAPGNYVVQFNGGGDGLKKSRFAVVVSAAKQKVSAEDVEGAKFSAGGVAMRLEVKAPTPITGQVAAQTAAAGADGNAKVKVINGKRYVWVGPEVGSHMGGRWVEEGSAEAKGAVSSMSRQAIQNRQDHGDGSSQGSGSGR